jgi:hypothetical protein
MQPRIIVVPPAPLWRPGVPTHDLLIRRIAVGHRLQSVSVESPFSAECAALLTALSQIEAELVERGVPPEVPMAN